VRGIFHLTTLLRSLPVGSRVFIKDEVAQDMEINLYFSEGFEQVDGVAYFKPDETADGEWMFVREREAA